MYFFIGQVTAIMCSVLPSGHCNHWVWAGTDAKNELYISDTSFMQETFVMKFFAVWDEKGNARSFAAVYCLKNHLRLPAYDNFLTEVV